MSHVSMKVVVFGLEDDLSSELESALTGNGAVVAATAAHTAEECIDKVRDEGDVVFCGANPNDIRTVRSHCPSASIIVLSRAAEVDVWIDALEAGADDYYATPLDRTQVRWMMESMQARRSAA